MPLVRYRIGDYGKLATVTLPDGRRARVIQGLEGRAPVCYRAADGRPVTSVDIARTVRPIGPFVQHLFRQRADGAVELRLRPIPDVPIALDAMENALRRLFGDDTAITVVLDDQLGRGEGKLVSWQSELV
jgi:phenylacetate-CoA ligase